MNYCVPSAQSRDCTQQALSINHGALVPTRLNTQPQFSVLQYGDDRTTRTGMPTQHRMGQLHKAVARAGCTYHHPHFRTEPLSPDSWPYSCSLLSLRPRCKQPWVFGNPTLTTLHDASCPEFRAPGVRGAEGNTRMFSVQLPDTGCRILNSKIKWLQVGLPPGGLTQAKPACQQIPSTP